MKVTMSLEGLWNFLQSLSLSTKNKKWLAEKLQEAVRQEELEKSEDQKEDDKFYHLAGIWQDDIESDKIEEAIRHGRLNGKTRHIVSFDD